MNDKAELVKREETTPERSRQIPAVAPVVDIYEDNDEILLHAEMPGVAKEDITVNVDNGKLTITGIRKMTATGVANWAEFGDVEYTRIFSVPQAIDVGKVNAELRDGVLRLHLPKSEAAKPRQIEIKAA
ncbi:MAG: Hsp20/alpha crystallin family protein [Proteobacteria bacterium]|nr:Hsp20/alpha crystallin family protein [Pseudomonadota bacterium]MBU4295187.1 Hsp20/alpha crystallin family protein [Pseudomonadota bacterium]MCG2749031.1 Hsp20/alpha crystallin family protein [Desulfobulbaceae bacterium]